MTAKIPPGKYIGRPADGGPPDDGYRCEACGAFVPYRDLGKVLAHEGPLPHPPEDRPQ